MAATVISSTEMDAQRIIANASGGRALQGLLWPEGGDAGNDTDKFSTRMHLLQSVPATGEGFCIRNSNQSTVTTDYLFARLEDAHKFANRVAEKGWSLATGLYTNVLPGTVSANAILSTDQTQKTLSERQSLKHVSQALILKCDYVPLNCFQIPREQMMLSESALQRACTIESSADADAFLTSFGAFASESRYQLGGVYFSVHEKGCLGESSVSALRNHNLQELKGSVGAGFQCVGAEGLGKFWKSRDASSIKGSASKELEEKKGRIVIGPIASNIDDFHRMLQENPDCRAIIDKSPDTSNSLVSVWSLLVQHGDHMGNGVPSIGFKKAASKLCERWLEKASCLSSCKELPALYIELIQHSWVFLDKLASDPVLGLQYKHLPLPAPAPLTQLSQMDLVDGLVQILHEAQDSVSGASNSINISQRISLFLRSYSSGLSQIESDILGAYGFHPRTDDYDCSMNGNQLESLIQELIKAKSGGEHALPLSTVNWEHNDGIQHCDLVSIVETSLSPCFSYFGDMVVDRIFSMQAGSFKLEPEAKDHSQDYSACHPALFRHLIDCVRHRLDHFKYLVVPFSSTEASENSDSESDSDEELKGDRDEQASAERMDLMRISPFELLIQIIQGSDLHLQIVLCDLLLSQRSAIPLIMSRLKPVAADQDEVPLVQYMQILKFVPVEMENERKLCLGTDMQMPRVLFLSSKSLQESHAAIIASRVCNCNFLSKRLGNDVTEEATVMEVGVGFIERHELRDYNGESGYWECVAIHVTGNFDRAMGFIGDIADVIVLELKEEGQDAQPINLPPSATALKWRETGSKPGFDKRTKVIQGQETFIVEKLQRCLGRTIRRLEKKLTKSRPSIIEVCQKHPLLLHPAHRELDSWEKHLLSMFCQCDIRNKLPLQYSHKREADAYFGGLNSQKNDRISKHEKDMACISERKDRRKLAETVIELPLMILFHHVLEEEFATKRRFGITWIERSLAAASEGSEAIFQAPSRDRKAEHASYSHETKQDNANKIRLENLWREMGHIYEADPDKRRYIARLAAQHLLDGFPLEILDGDVRMYCKLWVETVLLELEFLVAKATSAKPGGSRIFVLSVMGMQSSGKSTMMNLMFGTRLRTGTGRCTRGVYIQLVPAKRQEYDYVLLVDTEGLKSPENTGLDGSAVRDNQLATFGLLPADACLFMICNEDDVAVKEVLPMVLLAFKGSTIAQMYGDMIKTKLILVYRSVDTTEDEKLKKSARLVEEHLQKAAQDVHQMGCFLSASSPTTQQNLLSSSTSSQSMPDEAVIPFDFKVTGRGNQGDVWFMGNLRSGSNPPKDTPEWSYGERVIELREYLHSRVVNNSGGWRASTFQEFANRVSLAWDCICSAEFELTFYSRVEYASYLELQEKLRPQRSVISDKYMEAFRDLEIRILRDDEDKPYEETTIAQLTEFLFEEVANDRASQTEEVNKILDMRKIYGKWKAEELVNWRRFCNNTENWYKRRIADLVSGVLRFGKIVAEYQKRCKSKLVSEIEKDRSDAEKQEMFEVILNEIVHDAEKMHPSVAKVLRQKVCAQYSINKLGNVAYMDLEHVSRKPLRKPRQAFFYSTEDEWPTTISEAIAGSENSESHSPDAIKDLVNIISERTNAPIFQKLESMIESKLKDANQYSDAIVESVIKVTKEFLGDDQSVARRSRQDQEMIHCWVKETLIRRLKEIQDQWDKKYNVAEKLKSREIRVELQHFFNDSCAGLEATVLVVNQLLRELKEKLEKIHSDAVVSYLVRKLEKAAWVREWRVMRAILDYHLLTLMEIEDSTGRLLKNATHAADHYITMLKVLVGHSITEEVSDREWDRLLNKVQICLIDTATDRNPSVEVFLRDLKKGLTEMVDPRLGEAIVSMYVKDKSSKLDGEFYRNKLPQLSESLEKLPKPDVRLRRADITEAVLQEMAKSPDEHCRPRCEATCPLCGSMCHLAKGHNFISNEKHDTLHQPAGLGGNTGLGGNNWFGNKRMVSDTCFDLLKRGCKIRRKNADGKLIRVNFDQFEQEYSDWKKPSSSYDAYALHVRECLFFNFHRQLAKHWHCSPAKDIPTRYDHINAELRAHLHNFLSLKIPEWNQLVELLPLVGEDEL